MEDLPEHARRNREEWNANAHDWVDSGRRHWSQDAPTWGAWEVPEEQLGAIGEVDGLDAIELGCGTAYWSAWLARAGARVTGVDISENQLATAAELQREHGLEFPLIHCSAESVPLPGDSFDFALSEYGAAIWCEPRAWISEAARLLRPGGRLVFLGNSPLSMLCAPPSDQPVEECLHRGYGGLGAMEWPDELGVNFCVPHSETMAILRENGFVVEALHELIAPPGDPDELKHYVTRGWAMRWPCEDLWVARLSAQR
jgi:SAM-dependent methyltransferase